MLLEENATNLGATMHALEVMPDLGHMVIESAPTRAPAELANRLKGFASRTLRAEFPHFYPNKAKTLALNGQLAGACALYNAAHGGTLTSAAAQPKV